MQTNELVINDIELDACLGLIKLMEFNENNYEIKVSEGRPYYPRNKGACYQHRKRHQKCKLDCPNRYGNYGSFCSDQYK